MLRRFALAALAVASLVLVARGQDPFGRKADDWNVGPLGIGAAVEGNKVTIRSLVAGGPAERAGLRPGETIKGVEGRDFTSKGEPVAELVAACEAADAAAKREAVVTLTVTRDGKDVPVKVAFPALGRHAATCPKKCKKCERAVQMGAALLLSKQAADGHFPTELGGKTGLVVVTSLSGLALLSAGGADAAVARAADYVIAKCGAKEDSPFGRMGAGGGNWNQENWELGYGALFLAEFAKKTRRADAKAKLAELVQRIEANQEASGGWAHGPGGPNALGYLELEIVTNWCLMGLGGAAKNGLAVDKGKLAKAFAWIEETTNGNGGVGYSPRQGQKGFGEAGRTSGALAAYALLGQEMQPFYAKMAGFYRGHYRSLPEGHVSPCMHLLTGAIAAYQLGPRDWQSYVEAHRGWIYAARRPDGSFAPTPTRESQSLRSNTDASVGPCWTTATYVLILSLPNERVPLLLDMDKADRADKPGKKPGKTATGSEPRVPDVPPPTSAPPDKD